MQIRVIIQARTDSDRLPAKALLPVGGLPSAVLAAKRAGNIGHEVLLATTKRDIDSTLVDAASAADVAVFRGATDDVRQRFLEASYDLDDEDVIVRLTADNVVPDGKLVACAVEALTQSRALLVRSMSNDRLPYGLAVEAMRAGALRASVSWRDDPHAREHVTPGLIDRAGRLPRFLDLGADHGHLRCTIDTFKDYECVANLFKSGEDPVSVGWHTLIDRLTRDPASAPSRTPGPGLIVGTAQLEMPYGSVRQTTPPSTKEAREIVLRAARCGHGIDTAPAYGRAEELIGHALRGGDGKNISLSTKIDVGIGSRNAPPALEELRTEACVLRSRLALRSVMPDLLVHRPAQRTVLNGAVWNGMQNLQEQGMVGRLGVSVYTPQEALAALEDPAVQVLQLPFNLLDKRWSRYGVVAAVKDRKDLTIHARSVFLQGILVQPTAGWPRMPGIDGIAIQRQLADVAHQIGRHSIADLCIAYVRGHALHHGWMSGVIVGIESMKQLRDTEVLFGQRALDEDELGIVDELLPEVPEPLLDPSAWPSANT